MAFVIVQHLDPTHKGIMAELLQRATGMKVVQVKDRTKVQPDCVYVIPPNKDMSILHGVLHLLEPAAPRGLRLPIDFFLRSLAEDQQEHSIGVILSGMGSDGTLGLRAIKEKAGVVLVQEPASAKFDGMPRSAIDAGLADIVAPAEELPGKILAYLQRTPLIAKPEAVDGRQERRAPWKRSSSCCGPRRATTSPSTRQNTLYRRIERRMGIHQIDRIAAYVRYLQENPAGTGSALQGAADRRDEFFPRSGRVGAVARRGPAGAAREPHAGQALRAWVPGCSTGEEAYSLAIVFKEALEQTRAQAGTSPLQIFATDLDRDAIDKARQGVFPANIAADVSPERLSRFFIKEERGYRVRKEIREMVIFAAAEPHHGSALHQARHPELPEPADLSDAGAAEETHAAVSLQPESRRHPVSRQRGDHRQLHRPLRPAGRQVADLSGGRNPSCGPEPVEFPSSFTAGPPAGTETRPTPNRTVSLQSLADQLVLQRYAPPAVLVNDKGDILYISGRTGKYLEPAAGKANWNIFAMAREGLALRTDQRLPEGAPAKRAGDAPGLKVGTNGGTQCVDITVQQLDEAGGAARDW